MGRAIGQTSISEYGFWARFLLPPQAPVVRATQGEFNDRVLVVWNEDPLSASATRGYVLKRDGAFLAQLEPGTLQFIDFNVQAGEFYEYTVTGRNEFGGGGGPQVQISVLLILMASFTGRITTLSGNPVADAIVTLGPNTGRSLSFDGVDDYLCVSYGENMPTEEFTFTTWLKPKAGNDAGTVIDLGSDLKQNFWVTNQDCRVGSRCRDRPRRRHRNLRTGRFLQPKRWRLASPGGRLQRRPNGRLPRQYLSGNALPLQ